MTDKHSASEAALHLALPVLRDLLQSDVECVACFHDGAPKLADLSAPDRAWLRPTLEAVQAAEAALGRPNDTLPDWLNVLIDSGLPDTNGGSK